MPYSSLSAAQIKIHGDEIRDAMGFEKSWLAGVCFFLRCLTASDLSGLSQLLDQVDEHNQLVSAIEIDLQQASSANPANDALQTDLYGVVKTFSQTKQKILKAIAQQNNQSYGGSTSATNDIIQSMGGDATKLQNVYGGLIRKSYSLGIRAQELIFASNAFTSTSNRAIIKGYRQQLKVETKTTSSLNGTLSNSIHGWARP